MSRARRFVLVLVAALATASTAAADGTAPTVTLLSPANGTTLTLDGQHNPAFSWRIDYAQPPTQPTSADRSGRRRVRLPCRGELS